MRSVMKHQFSQVPKANIPRSSFDRSHGLKTAFDSGLLIPIFLDEALPGDTFNLNMTAFARMATPLFPTMDNLVMSFYFFAVPNRLVWDNWEKFCGAQDSPGDSTDYTIPTTSRTNIDVGSIYDYMGIPTGVANSITFSALPCRAYSLIWNEWFRDQNLQNPLTVATDDGPDNSSSYGLRRRGKPHDYFTSALPWPQKGDSVDIPLGTFAPIVIDETEDLGGGTPAVGDLINYQGIPSGNYWYGDDSASGVTLAGGNNPFPSANAVQLKADLSDATAATINQLRQAFQIQKLLERDARGGTRYTEVVRAHFGVTSPDARLQRPEYLGGGRTYINISPVPQTSETDASPQGNLAAYGTATANNIGFSKSFTEHCIIIGLACVTADLTYQQGLNRSWSRQTRYDYYWPALATIGEQAVLNKEIYTQGTSADNDVFGYQERFAEYRYKPSQITGVFRSTAAGTLDAWHLSQEFTSLPTLNSTFIEEHPPVSRVVATPDEPEFLFDGYFRLKCARPMPLYGVPGNIDRF